MELEVAFEPPVGVSTPSGDSTFVIAIDAQEPGNQSASVEGLLRIDGQPAIASKLFEATDKGHLS